MTDKEAIYYELLVLRCQRGQKDALEELVGTWEKRLFYYIRRLIDDEKEAWQILQEIWLKVLRDIKKLRDGRKLPAWLYRIARNTAISHLRAKHIRQALLEHDKNLCDIEDDAYSPAFEDAEQVHFGLGQISIKHREILTLFFL